MVMGRLGGENAEMQKELEVLFLTKEIVITSTNEMDWQNSTFHSIKRCVAR